MLPLLDYSLLSTYLGMGVLNWIGTGAGAFLVRQRLDLLYKRKYDLPDPAPRVSIVIPAKNEGEPLRRCLASALGQDYPDFEVIAINDRSTDNTGAIMDEMAAANPDKLKVLHVKQDPPSGWTGKCAALHQAAPQATGRWLLFIDSDVTLEPQVLRKCLAYGIHRNHQMVSLILGVADRSLSDALITPVAASTMFTLYSIPMSNRDSQVDNGFANGQFILVRRDAYEKVGGHEAVRDSFSEDVALGKLVKKAGFRPRITLGEKDASVRLYTTLAGGLRGWSRNFFGMCAGNQKSLWAATVFTIFNFFSIFPALAFAIYRYQHPIVGHEYLGWTWIGLVIAHWVVMTIVLALIYGWSTCPRWLALLSPVAGVLMLVIFFKAMRLCVTRKVVWRGDSYAAGQGGFQ